MALLYVDELNTLSSKTDVFKGHEEAIRTWFEEMYLPTDEIQRRIDLAEDMDYLFYSMFLIGLADYKTSGSIDTDYLYDYALGGYKDILNAHGMSSDSTNAHAEQTVRDIVDATNRHIGDTYYTSADRSLTIAQNEGNMVGNDAYETEMISKGYTSKTWVTMKDIRVRHTHYLVDEVTIGINDVFQVGNSEMRFPCDTSLGAEDRECINCRCVLKYGGRKSKMRLKDEESVFTQGENAINTKDRIKPHNIIKELNKSEIGKTCLEYLEKNNIPVILNYTNNQDNCYGSFFRKEITIYISNTKSVEETAITVIHEATHAMLRSSNLTPFEEEFECFANEYRHKGIELTEDIRNDIIKNIKEWYEF